MSSFDLLVGEVVTLKLNSGEELVTRIEEYSSSDRELVILDPLSVAPGPNGVGLIPSLFTADPKSEHRINTSSVALYAVTDGSVRAKYLEATTGIIMPDKKIIMG